MLLEVDRAEAGYGDFKALFGISLGIEAGTVASVIGANGAGKSTLLKTIAGLLPLTAGEIRLDGRSLNGVPAFQRLRQGISLVPEGRRIFSGLTVEENLEIGAYSGRRGPWTKERVYETFPLLRRLANRSAARLSGGEQQALAIGRGLMSNPTVMLLDEVSLGLAPIVVKQLYSVVPAIRDNGTSLLIVEQDINQALTVADHAACLLEGRVALSGAPSSLTREAISAAYFGLAGRAPGGPE